MDNQQVKGHTVCLADIPEPTPEERAAHESAYRRGVSQALGMACDMVRAGATGKDLARLTDLSMSMRYDHEPHPTYLDELRQRFRPSKMRAKG